MMWDNTVHRQQEGTANSKVDRDIKAREWSVPVAWKMKLTGGGLQVTACIASVEASSTTSESISSSSSALGSDSVDVLGRQSVRLLVINVVAIVCHVTSQAATAEKKLADCWPSCYIQHTTNHPIFNTTRYKNTQLGDTLRIRGAMPVRVHMDDTGRMVNRKTKTDTNPIPDPNRYRRRCPDPGDPN